MKLRNWRKAGRGLLSAGCQLAKRQADHRQKSRERLSQRDYFLVSTCKLRTAAYAAANTERAGKVCRSDVDAIALCFFSFFFFLFLFFFHLPLADPAVRRGTRRHADVCRARAMRGLVTRRARAADARGIRMAAEPTEAPRPPGTNRTGRGVASVASVRGSRKGTPRGPTATVRWAPFCMGAPAHKAEWPVHFSKRRFWPKNSYGRPASVGSTRDPRKGPLARLPQFGATSRKRSFRGKQRSATS